MFIRFFLQADWGLPFRREQTAEQVLQEARQYSAGVEYEPKQTATIPADQLNWEIYGDGTR